MTGLLSFDIMSTRPSSTFYSNAVSSLPSRVTTEKSGSIISMSAFVLSKSAILVIFSTLILVHVSVYSIFSMYDVLGHTAIFVQSGMFFLITDQIVVL